MAIETAEQAKTQIQRWLDGRGLYRDDIISAKNVSFQLNGINGLGIAFSIIQPASLKTSVVVIGQVNLHPTHYKALVELDKSDRDDFLFGLKRDLIFRPPAFMFKNPEIPESIQFSKEIMFDELSECKIRDEIDEIIKCVVLVAWTFTNKFGVPEGV